MSSEKRNPLSARALVLLAVIGVLAAFNPLGSCQEPNKKYSIVNPKIDHVDVADADADGEAVTSLPLADALITAKVTTDAIDGRRPSYVWIWNYREGNMNLPELNPREAVPATTADAGATWTVATGLTAALAPSELEVRNNTLAVWAYYSLDGHVRIYRQRYRYEGHRSSTIKVALNGQPLRDGAIFTRTEPAASELVVTASTLKHQGVPASKLFFKHLVGTQLAPGNHPYDNHRDAQPATLIVENKSESPATTQKWCIVAQNSKVIAASGAPQNNTVLLWAVYDIDGDRIFRVTTLRYAIKPKN